MKDRMARAALERAEADGRLGPGSTIVVVASVRLAERLGAGATVATIIVDSGLRYLSTDLYRSN
jgi:cysteine synthase